MPTRAPNSLKPSPDQQDVGVRSAPSASITSNPVSLQIKGHLRLRRGIDRLLPHVTFNDLDIDDRAFGFSEPRSEAAMASFLSDRLAIKSLDFALMVFAVSSASFSTIGASSSLVFPRTVAPAVLPFRSR